MTTINQTLTPPLVIPGSSTCKGEAYKTKNSQKEISSSCLQSTASAVTAATVDAPESSKKKTSQAPITPDKYYPLRADGKLAVTPSVAKATRVIYVILNKETGERYVGKTEQELRERLYSHNFGIAHPEKKTGQKKLYEDIRENPGNFQFGILRKVDDKENIIEAEKELIAAKNAYECGYNLTRGGGAQKTGSGKADLPDEVPTPKKYYAFDEAELKFQFSPAVAKTKNVIYVIYDQETGKRYVGKTGQELRQRFNAHHFNIAHPHKEDGDAELYAAIRQRPEDFFAGILYQPPGEEDDLDVLESYLIREKNAYEEGYNRAPGVTLTFEEQ